MPEADRIFYNNITSLQMKSYEFVLCYAEDLSETVPEFPHSHDLHQIHFVLDGALDVQAGRDIVRVDRHRLLFLAKGIPHHALYEPRLKKRYFTVIYDIIPSAGEKNKANSTGGDCEWRDFVNVLDAVEFCGHALSNGPFDGVPLLDEIRKEQMERRIGWNTSLCLLYYRFVVNALRHMSRYETARDVECAGKKNLAMAASKFIHRHYMEDISLESVAEHLNISPRHLNRSYRSMFGTTLMKNLSLLRIEYAKYYIVNTNYTLEEISEKVGFFSVRTLYKLFREYKDVSVSRYLLQNRRAARE
ncbi:MAG: AraC family transcriptional regulator [Synergistaceae bacterium]|jgi:AraC-like DNA-binding protein|nr:AraC family transcriptional regulator [Synergistaceae bacterium]